MKKILSLVGILFVFITTFSGTANASLPNSNASSLYKTRVKSIVSIKTQDTSGSGVIINEDGTLVTCFHVIANADTILVGMEDGSIYYVDGFRYINPLSDVAILTLNTTRKFTPLKIANSYKIGEKIYTISNPQGLDFTFSDGIINQKTKDYIQFSAPISSGSSGGALLNKNGNLLGIITSQLIPSKAQNVNFALPNEYFISKVRAPKITNENDLPWTEFLVEHANEEQFKMYTNYAINEENYGMLYKYLKPFAARTDIPDDLYPTFGYLALLAYLDNSQNECLEDAINFFKISYQKKQKEEATLFMLSLLSGLQEDSVDGEQAEYLEQLSEKFPQSLDKLLEIAEKIQNSDEAISDYFKYFNKLMGY